MECLDANVVRDLMSGTLEAAMRAAVLGHVDACEACRQRLSLARSQVKSALPLDATAVPINVKNTLAPEMERAGERRRAGLEATAITNTARNTLELDATALPTATDLGPVATTMHSSDTGPGLDETALSTAVGPTTIRPPHVSGRPHGRVFGRYTLIDRLGAGAMGVVWRAEDNELRRHIALKLLKRP